MPWAAALILGLIYAYNIPIEFAFIFNGKNYGTGLRPFSASGACRAARRRALGEEKHIDYKQIDEKLKKFISPGQSLKIALRILPYIKLEYARAQVRLGVDDAAATAVICGALTAALHMIGSKARLRGELRVTPVFQEKAMDADVCAVFSVCAGDALRETIHGYFPLTRGY